MSDTFIGSGATRWQVDHSAGRDRESFSRVCGRYYFRLSRPGHLARLHMIAAPPGSSRAIAAASDAARVRSYFMARNLGMSPAQVIASRTRAVNGVRSPWSRR